MTDVSLNGWPVLDAGDSRLATGQIPGTDRHITINRAALPLFLHFAAAWNAEMPPRLKLTDHKNQVDSWEVRQARAAHGYSNHASATATDFAYRILLADNQRHMTDAERIILRRILARYVTSDGHHVLANGYAWGKCDEMHSELSQAWDSANGAKRNTTIADVNNVIARLSISADGRTRPTPTASIPPFKSPFTVGTTQFAQTKAIQTGLGLTVDGQFGPRTLAAVSAYQKKYRLRLLLPKIGVVDARTYKALARPI